MSASEASAVRNMIHSLSLSPPSCQTCRRQNRCKNCTTYKSDIHLQTLLYPSNPNNKITKLRQTHLHRFHGKIVLFVSLVKTALEKTVRYFSHHSHGHSHQATKFAFPLAFLIINIVTSGTPHRRPLHEGKSGRHESSPTQNTPHSPKLSVIIQKKKKEKIRRVCDNQASVNQVLVPEQVLTEYLYIYVNKSILSSHTSLHVSDSTNACLLKLNKWMLDE